jgi:hypothetical protein
MLPALLPSLPAVGRLLQQLLLLHVQFLAARGMLPSLACVLTDFAEVGLWSLQRWWQDCMQLAAKLLRLKAAAGRLPGQCGC